MSSDFSRYDDANQLMVHGIPVVMRWECKAGVLYCDPSTHEMLAMRQHLAWEQEQERVDEIRAAMDRISGVLPEGALLPHHDSVDRFMKTVTEEAVS